MVVEYTISKSLSFQGLVELVYVIGSPFTQVASFGKGDRFETEITEIWLGYTCPKRVS